MARLALPVSALALGCREADVLLVDGAMVPINAEYAEIAGGLITPDAALSVSGIDCEPILSVPLRREAGIRAERICRADFGVRDPWRGEKPLALYPRTQVVRGTP